MRERILEAAKAVAWVSGFDAEVTAIARRAEISTSTFYRHFSSREAVIRALVVEMREHSRTGIAEVGAIADPSKALDAWMHFGFWMTHEYGRLALMIAAELVPAWAKPEAEVQDLYRFTGRVIGRWRDVGGCDPRVDVKAAVRLWFALVSPVRVLGCLADGMSTSEIAEETLAFLTSSLGK